MDFDQVPTTMDLEEILDTEGETIIIPELAEKLKAQRQAGDFFPTGIKNFDEVMGGLGEGDLVLISGRTGQGKTTLAQTMAMNLTDLGIPHAWFSYEVMITELWRKFQEMGATKETFTGYAPTKLTTGNIDWIENRIKEAILKFNIKAVFVDHLGFLTPKVGSTDPRKFEMNFSNYLGQLTRQLKEIAMKNKITVVLLAHTRKTREELDIEDIAHSSGVAQESDFVFLVERMKNPSAARKDAWDEAAEEGFDVYTNFSKVKLVKNRRTGYTKAVKLEFRKGRLQEVKAHNVLVNNDPGNITIE